MRKKAEKHSSKLINELMAGRDKHTTAMTRNRMLLAAKIDDGIKAKGWGKSQFAEKMGKEPSVITKWLSGTHNFTSDRLTEIGLVLGIELLRVDSKPNIIRYQPVIVTQNSENEIQVSPELGMLINEGIFSQRVIADC